VGINVDSFYQWHHYSAYIGQAELLNSGVIPYVDIPLQYGFGPVFITSLVCQFNCWEGLYWITSFGNFLTSITLTILIFLIIKVRNSWHLFLTATLILISCLFYTSYQNFIFPTSTFPSTLFLRFYPAIFLLIILIVDFKYFIKLKSNIYTCIIYIYWSLTFAWSPEAGIQSSVILAPYLLWKSSCIKVNYKILVFFKELMYIFIRFFICISLIFLFFKFYYGEFPSLKLYFTYLLFAPVTKVNVDFYNPMLWYFLISFIIFAKWFSVNSKLKIDANIPIWLTILLNFANFTYYLAHSDNAVLFTLVPYLTISLIAIQSTIPQGMLKKSCTIFLGIIVGQSLMFNGWNEIFQTIRKDPYISKKGFSSDAKTYSELFSRSTTTPFQINSETNYRDKDLDIFYASEYIRVNYKESLDVFDELSIMDSKDPFPPWNAYHSPVNIWSIPSIHRRVYLYKTSKRLNRSGWILYDQNLGNNVMKDILDDYSAVYNLTNEEVFGSYKARRYEPKK
jgi:hypothetical protein